MKHPNLSRFALLATLALAACQQPADDINITIDDQANNNVVSGPLDDNSAAAGNAPGASPTNTASPATLPTQIPAMFHGRWGINRADCTSTRGDAKGLLIINDARLTFYESKGTIAKVLGATANRFDANFGFTGEGQTWERIERFTVVNDKLQRRTDAATGQEPPVNLTYLRCDS